MFPSIFVVVSGRPGITVSHRFADAEVIPPAMIATMRTADTDHDAPRTASGFPRKTTGGDASVRATTEAHRETQNKILATSANIRPPHEPPTASRRPGTASLLSDAVILSMRGTFLSAASSRPGADSPVFLPAARRTGELGPLVLVASALLLLLTCLPVVVRVVGRTR